MKVIKVSNVRNRVSKVREILRSAGNTIGSVHFTKREDGSLRKMSYRIRVFKPTYASKPQGKGRSRSANLMTVFDVNKVRYNRMGRICGRGDWRSIPLDNVRRICVNGEIYKVIS